jgi:hypothetical protein
MHYNVNPFGEESRVAIFANLSKSIGKWAFVEERVP